ncbi:MAG: glycosyltransferase family 2 protein [Xanthobacteraceae bacterium]
MAERPDTRRVTDGSRPAAGDPSSVREAAWPAVRGGTNAARRPVAIYPELDCVRHRIPLAAVTATERRARELGITADHVLLTGGFLDEETYVRALAHSLGLAFEPLDGIPRERCPLDDSRLIDAQAAGLLPLVADDELTLVIAPRGIAARRLFTLVQSSPNLQRRSRLTTEQRLRCFVERHDGGKALGRRAAFGLLAATPEFSAARQADYKSALAMAGALLAMLAAAVAVPDLTIVAASIVLSAIFLAWTGLRLLGVFAAASPAPALPRQPVDSLPVWTIIIALYREAQAMRGLIASLDSLDWPPEKLDIKFVLERDDHETRAVLQRLSLRRPYDVLVAPDIGPRTKPKALNAALPFARGAFVTVFDAEDRPEPDQLRHAYESFLAHDDRLACVQARLTIDNTGDGWLTAMFTAEYAGLFDVLLPALARRHLPLPLGGSSNHFRTAALRAAGGWDPHNLTEDADLGMRLARLGYRSAVIASSTYEEAPARLLPWLRQRRRWFQGWMQTWLVHMRAPARVFRELGPSGFITLQLVVGGTVLAALIHPLFLAAFALDAVSGGVLDEQGLAGMLMAALCGTTFAGGYLTSVLLGAIGLARRRLMSSAWVLLLVPVHWLLLSLAAWQAAIKLVRDPYRWDKTEHGRASTSRRAGQACSDATSQPHASHIAAANIRLSSASVRSA